MNEQYILYNGVGIPKIAYGTWRLPDDASTVEIIKKAVSVGYRHIDTAAKYGNEASVGQAVRECGVSRSELFITDKLRNTSRGYRTTIEDFDRALSVMGLDYLDLYMIHWPAGSGYYENWREINAETWRAMERLYADGKVRSIGISNFWPHHIDALSKTWTIKPMVAQLKVHPGFLQAPIVRYCQYVGMLVEAYSPLGAGKLLASDALTSIAAKYQRTTAQICIRWCLQHGLLPLPKSGNEIRMAQNLDVFDFVIEEKDMELLDYMDTGLGNEVRDPDALNLD